MVSAETGRLLNAQQLGAGVGRQPIHGIQVAAAVIDPILKTAVRWLGLGTRAEQTQTEKKKG